MSTNLVGINPQNKKMTKFIQLIPVELTLSPKPNYGVIQNTINFLIQKKLKNPWCQRPLNSVYRSWMGGIRRRSKRSGEEERINAVRSGSTLYRDDLTIIKNLYSKEEIAFEHGPILERNLFWKLILLSKKNQTFPLELCILRLPDNI